MNIKKKALSPIIATILLVVVSVILVTVIMSFGQSFTAQGLDKTKDIKELSQSDAEHFVYPKTFSSGVMQFNYSPPNNSFGDVQITKYKILYDNNETSEITLTNPHTLSTGTNLLNLEDFSDQNITSNKFTIILETEDNEYITLKNITNPFPYVEPEPYIPQEYFTEALSPGTMADDATIGTQAWSSLDYSKASDNSYSSVNMGNVVNGTFSGYTTHYLKANNFGFNIPTGATINGIKVEIEKYTFGPYISWDLKIVKADGSIGDTNMGSGTWPTPSDPNTYETYGSDTNVWGETWTAENINDSDFGVVISIIGLSQMGGCLNENTLIATEFGQKAITDLNIGDLVISYNENTKQLELKPIINIWSVPISNVNSRYFYIYYNNGQLIKATENHKFYIDGNYVRADELNVGDKLLSNDFKEYPIENIEIVENTTDYVWDIEVEDNHNFFANNILVHNLNYYAYVDHIRMTVYYTN
ncbi:MAG TPA: Hint domain-containing protein [archaeon]|nr:Hint domain-containing protein [archaeon]